MNPDSKESVSSEATPESIRPVGRPRVYLETTIPSYVTASPSRDLIRAGQQAVTHLLWQQKRNVFDWFTSLLVKKECAAGDPISARERIAWLEGIPLLDESTATISIAEQLLKELPFPVNSNADALHIAIACTHQMNFLLSWNCKHIANPAFAIRIQEVARRAGFTAPTLCTPYELLGE